MEYFTSDWHLGHKRIIELSERPFSSLNEMKLSLLDNTLSILKKDDTLFMLGDFSFKKEETEYALSALKDAGIHFFWVLGNHDEKNAKEKYKNFCEKISSGYFFSRDGYRIFLSHFPHLFWNESQKNSWSLFGHVHIHSPEMEAMKQLSFSKKMMNVNCELHNYKPVSLEEVRKEMEQKDDNLEFLFAIKRSIL